MALPKIPSRNKTGYPIEKSKERHTYETYIND